MKKRLIFLALLMLINIPAGDVGNDGLAARYEAGLPHAAACAPDAENPRHQVVTKQLRPIQQAELHEFAVLASVA